MTRWWLLFSVLAADVEGLLKLGLRLRQLALRVQHMAQPAMRHRQLPLPLGVLRFFGLQLKKDRQSLAKRRVRLRQLALGLKNTAQLAVRHGKIPRSEERRVGKECRSRW